MSTPRQLRNFVNGQYVEAHGGRRQDVIDPSTGAVVASAPVGTEADVDAAYAAAATAFETWGRTTPSERQAALLKIADAYEARAEELIAVETENTGKPKALTASEEIPPMCDQIRFFAGAARVLEGRAAGEYMPGHTSWIRREPIGVVGQVTPWNYPMMMAAWKIGPALAAGNSIVLKPSDTTPETTAAIVAHLLAARRGSPGSVRVVGMEPHEIAKTCRRLVSRLEPDLVQARADANRATRLDVRTEPGAVGTSWLTAVLPSEIAAAIKVAVDAAGQRWRAEQPELPIGTARALGLADLVLCGSEVTAEVRLGVPIIASAVSRLTFAPVDDPTCPVCRGEEDPVAGLFEEGVTHEAVVHEHLRIVAGEGADAVGVLAQEWMDDDVTTQVRVGGGDRWVSGTTIPGVGFVPPDVVAAVVGRLDTRVGRALLDARTGTLLETSTSSYAIPRAQRDFVATRDGTCRMWGCDRPVESRRLGWSADVDHATPWPRGETSPANLSDLCRHHHRVKHSPRWGHRLREDGSTEWVTPGGVVAFTYPVHAVDEEGSSPLAGTNEPDEGSPASPWSPPVGTTEAEEDAPPF